MNAPLLWRVLAFLIVFVLISGIIGPRIISGGILYKYHFDVYAGLGKALLFGIIAFLLLAQRSKAAFQLAPWRARNSIWILLCIGSAIYAWIGVSHLLKSSDHSDYWPVITHVSLLASIVFAAGGSFGPANIRRIAHAYRRELLLSLGLSIAFYGFLELVYGLWQVFSTLILHAVAALLRAIGLTVAILQPRTLLLTKFGIDISQYCSGIESIALFTALYTLIGILDWKRFNHQRFFILFPVGLLILFGCNILRVFGLILGGYYINPRVAFSLFHTYAGMVFFILYSIVFWSICYRFMLQNRSKPLTT